MVIRVTIVSVFVSIALQLSAQFKEQLDNEISKLKDRLELDGIPKDEYFTALDKMCVEISADKVNSIMTGAWWRYSHTVYPDGREVRLSNARGVLKFPDTTNAYYIIRNQKDTAWCNWNYYEGQLWLDRFKDKTKEGNPLSEPLNIFYIEEKRLVLTAMARSKKYPDKYRAIFHVYFRR